MGNNNNFSKQEKPQEFELVELLFQEYNIQNSDTAKSFQERFQSYINQISSYLHSSCKDGFFTHFFFGVFSTLLDTKLGGKLNIKKLHYYFESSGVLKIVAETDTKTHVFIFDEKKTSGNSHRNNDIGFSKNEWRKLKGREYNSATDKDSLEISIINIKKSTGQIKATLEPQEDITSTSQLKRNNKEIEYKEITKGFKDNKEGDFEDNIKLLSSERLQKVGGSLEVILKYIKKTYDLHSNNLSYGDGAREANEHGFVAGVFNNFRYRVNAHTYLELIAGRGYADIILLVRGDDRYRYAIPIIIELKAGTGDGTTSKDALMQAIKYAKALQPNNARILSLSEDIVCVGINLDMPIELFIKIKYEKRKTDVTPLVRSILEKALTWGNNKNDNNKCKDDIISDIKDTYITFPGIQQMSSDRYMSRYLLGESIVLEGYNKYIFLYDEVYIETKTVINPHNTRSDTNNQNNKLRPGNKREAEDESSNSGSKKSKSEKINAVTTILYVPNGAATSGNPAVLLNIVEANTDDTVKNISLDSKLIGNRRIVQLDIQFRTDKSKKSLDSLELFNEYCNIKTLKSYDSVSEYNKGSEQVEGNFHLVNNDVSKYLMNYLDNTVVNLQSLDLSIVADQYKELLGEISKVIYPIKGTIMKEAEFQAFLEGVFKYYSDIKLFQDQRSRALVLVIPEYQTGGGKRIDLVIKVIGSSEQGTREYTVVGLELKYDDTIKLRPSDLKKDKIIQEKILQKKEQIALKKSLSDQPEMYVEGPAMKAITDGGDVIVLGVSFNQNTKDSSKLFLISDFVSSKVEHSSIWTTQLVDFIEFTPEWLSIDQIDAIKRASGDDLTLLSLPAKSLDDNALKNLKVQWEQNKNLLQSIDSLDCSYNFLSMAAIKEFILNTGLVERLTYLDISGNDFEFTDDNLTSDLNDFKEIMQKLKKVIKLKISDIEMSSEKACDIINFLSEKDKVSYLEIQDLDMTKELAESIAHYIRKTKTLTYLDLSRCEINDDHARIIIDALNRQTTLTTLIIAGNKISATGAEGFKTALPHSAICKLDLEDNPLGMDGFESIVEAIKNSKNVESIILNSIGIESSQINNENVKSFKELFSILRLKKVDVSSNNAGKALSTILSTLNQFCDSHKLEDLNISYNPVIVDTKTLSKEIRDFLSRTKVKSLYFAYMLSKKNYKIAQSIVQGLINNESLISCDLSGNYLSGSAIAKNLAKAIIKHKMLEHFKLSDNGLYKSDLETILQGVSKNTAISNLDLSGNNVVTTRERRLYQKCDKLFNKQDEIDHKRNENAEQLNELLNQYNNKVKELVNPYLFKSPNEKVKELFNKYNDKMDELFTQYNERERGLFNQYNRLANPYLTKQYINKRNELVNQYISEKDKLVNQYSGLATQYLVEEYNKQKDELDQQYNELDDKCNEAADLFAKARNIDFQNLLKGNTALKIINLDDCDLSPKSLESLLALSKDKDSGLEIIHIEDNSMIEGSDTQSDIIASLDDNVKQGSSKLRYIKIGDVPLPDTTIAKLKSLGIVFTNGALQLRSSDRELKIQELLPRSSDRKESIVQACLLPGSSRSKRSITECKIDWETIDRISKSKTRNHQEIIIDPEKFLEYIKTTKDEQEDQQLVALAKEVEDTPSSKIVSRHQTILNKVIEFGSYKTYLQYDRIKYVGHNIINRNDHSFSPILKLKLTDAMGKAQLIRGIHSTIVACNHGEVVDCSLSTLGLGFAFLSHPIEQVMSRLTPKVILKHSNVISKAIPKILSHDTKFMGHVIGVKYGTKIGLGIGAAIGGIFDIIDIARSLSALIECNKKAGSDNPCSDKEIRDNIVSIGFAGVGFVSGIVFTVTGATGVGIVVGFAIMVGQSVYSGVSNVIEYHEKYHTTLSEEWSIFWRTALFLDMGPDVQHLVTSTNAINKLADHGKKIIEDNPQVVAFAIGLGAARYEEKCTISTAYRIISLEGGGIIVQLPHKTCTTELHITPDYMIINMRDHSESNAQNISRVIPNHIDNMRMICLPKITNADYEKGSSLSVDYAKAAGFILSQLNPINFSKVTDLVSLFTDPSKIKDLIGYTDYKRDITAAIYYCQNAMVLLDEKKLNSSSGDKWMVYDLRYANKGEIIGSNTLNNEFSIFAGRVDISGGASTNNRFNLYSDQFQGKIYLANNSSNSISVYNVQCSNITMKYTDDDSIWKQLPDGSIYWTHRQYNMRVSMCGNIFSVYGTQESKITYTGREREVDYIDCHVQKINNIDDVNEVLIDGLGGKSVDQHDKIKNCNRVIVSPNTKVISNRVTFNNNGTFWIKYGNYTENFASSSIEFYGNATVIFPDSLLKSQLGYFVHNNTLSIYISSGLSSTWQLNLVPYIDHDSGLRNFQLINLDNITVIPIFDFTQNVTAIDHFQLFGKCHSQDSMNECIEYYKRIYHDKDYKVFGEMKLNEEFSFKFCSSKKDIIYIDEGSSFVQGNEESDIYIINIGTYKKRIIINNFANDQKLDIIKLDSLIKINKNISIVQSGSDLIINNFIILYYYTTGSEYQHILITTDDINFFIPWRVSEQEWILLPFYGASLDSNIFILSSSTKNAVLNIDLDNIVFYKDKNDLLLTAKKHNQLYSLNIILQGYYERKWLNNSLYAYNNGNISSIDLNNIKVSTINAMINDLYDDLLQEDTIDLYFHKVKEYDREKVVTVISHNIPFDDVKVTKDDNDLVLSLSKLYLNIEQVHNAKYKGQEYNISTIIYSTNVKKLLTIKDWYQGNETNPLMFEYSKKLEPERFHIFNGSEKKVNFNNELSNKIFSMGYTNHQTLKVVMGYLMLQCDQQEILAREFLEDEKSRLGINIDSEATVQSFMATNYNKNLLGEVLLLLAAKAYCKLSVQYPTLGEGILKYSPFNTTLSPAIIQEVKDCINLSTNFSHVEQFIDNNKKNVTKIIIESATSSYHKHRHHHGDAIDEHRSRVRRDIEDDESKIIRDNPDTIIESQNNVETILYGSSSSNLQPIGYNVVNWVRSEASYLKSVAYNGFHKITNWFNVDYDKGNAKISELELNEGNIQLLEPKYKADQTAYWSIGNDKEESTQNNDVNSSLLDIQGNLLFWDVLVRKMTGVSYNYGNKNTVITNNSKYAQELAYSAYVPNSGENNDYYNESSFFH